LRIIGPDGTELLYANDPHEPVANGAERFTRPRGRGERDGPRPGWERIEPNEREVELVLTRTEEQLMHRVARVDVLVVGDVTKHWPLQVRTKCVTLYSR